jgi:predicted dehydrogenase
MQKNSNLRVGVIGVGSMGQNHLRIYSGLADVSLVAIADTNKKLLDESARQYNISGYTDYFEMLKKENLDIVSVVVPTKFHHKVATDVISCGIHVLVEKPLAPTVRECKELIAAAGKKNVILGVGHIERFNPVITELKKQLSGNKLGKVIQVVIRRVGPYPQRIQDVGVLLDLATHDIDILHYIIDSVPKNLHCQTGRILQSGYEDLAVSTLGFQSGVIGVLIENWLSPTKIRDIAINGEKGMYIANFITQDIYFYENNFKPSSWESMQVFRGMAEGNMVRFAVDKKEPLRVELEAFVNAVKTDTPFLVGGKEGLYAVEIATKLMDIAAVRSK